MKKPRETHGAVRLTLRAAAVPGPEVPPPAAEAAAAVPRQPPPPPTAPTPASPHPSRVWPD